MAYLKIKRSDTSGNPQVLGAGELAYSNLTDNGSNGGDRLYIGTGIETSGNAVNHVVIGGKYFTDTINAATNSSSLGTLVKRDSSGNFSANNITANTFGTHTGSVIGNASTATILANSRTLSITGDITYTSPSFDGSADVTAAASLAIVNSNVGTFGSTTAVPVITVNAKGLVTSVTTVATSGSLTIGNGTFTDVVRIGTDTLSFIGGLGVSTTVTDNAVTLAIGQDVSTTSNVTFNNVTVNGVFNSNDITSTNISIAGNATITGNLIVQGTTTTINSTTLAIGDNNIVLAKDATTAAMASGAGLTVNGANATIVYDSGLDRWVFNKDIQIGTVYGSVATADTWTTARSLSLTGDATASLSVNGSQNVSSAITLATVNTSVGTYGNTTTVPQFTVNAKGLVTAVLNTSIAIASATQLGLASFSADNFTITSGNVSLAAVDGGTY